MPSLIGRLSTSEYNPAWQDCDQVFSFMTDVFPRHPTAVFPFAMALCLLAYTQLAAAICEYLLAYMYYTEVCRAIAQPSYNTIYIAQSVIVVLYIAQPVIVVLYIAQPVIVVLYIAQPVIVVLYIAQSVIVVLYIAQPVIVVLYIAQPVIVVLYIVVLYIAQSVIVVLYIAQSVIVVLYIAQSVIVVLYIAQWQEFRADRTAAVCRRSYCHGGIDTMKKRMHIDTMLGYVPYTRLLLYHALTSRSLMILPHVPFGRLLLPCTRISIHTREEVSVYIHYPPSRPPPSRFNQPASLRRHPSFSGIQ